MTPRPGPDRASARRVRVLGLDRLGVFVPVVMGLGIAFWLLTELRDLVHASGRAARSKRAAIAGYELARDALAETGGAPERRGLRPRPVYLVTGLASAGAAVYVAVGSIANFARDGGYVGRISWLLALACVMAVVGLRYGAVALATWVTYPRVPAWAQRQLDATPLTTRPSDAASRAGPAWWVGASFIAAAAAAFLVGLVVAVGPVGAGRLDRGATRWLRSVDPALPSVLAEVVFSPVGSLVLVVVTGLAALRCRALAITYAGASVIGLGLTVAIDTVVGHRGAAGDLVAGTGTFPSGAVVQAAIAAVFVPMAARTVGRRVLAGLSAVTLTLVTISVGVERIVSGASWPSDVIGGALIGVTVGLGGRWLLAFEQTHAGCRGCPTARAAGLEPAEQPVRGVFPLRVSTAGLLTKVAHLSSAAVVVGLSVLTLTVGIPLDAEGYALEPGVQRAIQLAFVALLSIGSVLAWRWPAVGAATIAVAGSMLGVFAGLQYPAPYAVGMALAAAVPAVLLWLSWQHQRTARELVALAVVTAVLVTAAGVGGDRLYQSAFGPTHPASSEPLLPADLVRWVWMGDLAPDGVTIVVRLEQRADRVAVVLRSDVGDEVSSPAVVPDDRGIARIPVTGLQPATGYRYAVVVDGREDRSRGTGSVETPSPGRMDLRVAVGACARTGSNGAVFDAIAAERADLFVLLGDAHYGNISSTSVEPFIGAFDRMLTAPAQAALYRSTPVAYVWDDHDYGPNDSDASSPSRSAARAAFRTAVPVSPVLAGDAPIQQAFTLGRVRFVLTDVRSERDGRSMLGPAQLDWLIDELVTSSRTHALVVWGSSVPWIGPASPDADGWAAYPDDRRRIADAIADNGVDNLVMVAGDAHMVAIDDGSNSDYSQGGGGGFPVLHAAALDRPGAVKGGPYSEGTHPGGGQYGVVDIVDGDDEVSVTLTGKTWDGRTLTALTRTFPVRVDLERRPVRARRRA